MRGLKPEYCHPFFTRILESRAIRPAYEGIETVDHVSDGRHRVFDCRAIRPAYEGIETARPL